MKNLSKKELKEIQGGGYLANWIARAFCRCPQTRHTNGRTYGGPSRK